MLFFKQQNAILRQKYSFIKEVYYKLFKLFIIVLKWNTLLAGLVLQQKNSIYYRNICIVSHRSKSVSRVLKVSRIIIREMCNKGLFFGFSKIS